MSAREAILAAVRAARLSVDDRPIDAAPDVRRVSAVFPKALGDAVERFTTAALATGTDVVRCKRSELPSIVSTRYASANIIVSMVPDVRGAALDATADPHSFANTDLFVCESEFGVAENGAVWLADSRLGVRAALFLANDVLIVLRREAIVENLHDAYSRLDLTRERFGIFVAGPSKTADIEQSLVIGAHGPKGMLVALVD